MSTARCSATTTVWRAGRLARPAAGTILSGLQFGTLDGFDPRVGRHDPLAPEPDALIGGVGTEIEFFGSGELLAGWPARAASGGIRRQSCDNVGRLRRTRVAARPNSAAHKISYYRSWGQRRGIGPVAVTARGRGAGGATGLQSATAIWTCSPRASTRGRQRRGWPSIGRFPPSGSSSAATRAMTARCSSKASAGSSSATHSPNSSRSRLADIYHAQGQYAAGVEEGLRHWLTQ